MKWSRDELHQDGKIKSWELDERLLSIYGLIVGSEMSTYVVVNIGHSAHNHEGTEPQSASEMLDQTEDF